MELLDFESIHEKIIPRHFNSQVYKQKEFLAFLRIITYDCMFTVSPYIQYIRPSPAKVYTCLIYSHILSRI